MRERRMTADGGLRGLLERAGHRAVRVQSLAAVVARGLVVVSIASCGSSDDGSPDEPPPEAGYHVAAPSNPSSPHWGNVGPTDLPSVGATCSVGPSGETFCGRLGRHQGSITLKNTGANAVDVLAYPYGSFGDTIVGVVVLGPGGAGCFSTTANLQEGYGIDIKPHLGIGPGSIEIVGIDSPSNCGNNGLNMVFEPRNANQPQWESTENPGKGYTCYTDRVPANGPDTYCGPVNSANLGTATGRIELHNAGPSWVRIVAYWQATRTGIGSYIMGPSATMCFDFRGSGALAHHITAQTPYGQGAAQITVTDIADSGGGCAENGLNMAAE